MIDKIFFGSLISFLIVFVMCCSYDRMMGIDVELVSNIFYGFLSSITFCTVYIFLESR